MIDVIFLAHGREEFTAASLGALIENTNWRRARLVIYTDGAPLRPLLSAREVRRSRYGGPVAVMNDHLARPGSEIFAKIDNDTIVPPGWLDTCLQVMESRPELDLLGIEPPRSRTPAPWASGTRVPIPESQEHWNDYAPCDMIGGIGLMRRRAFAGQAPMIPHGPLGVGGFSDWQLRHPGVRKGWIVPPLSVFVLDRLPIEPWAGLSRKYIAAGEQRPWTNYAPEDEALWNWWSKGESNETRIEGGVAARGGGECAREDGAAAGAGQ